MTNKAAAIAASRLISLAVARLAVASFLSSSVVFKGRSQRSVLAFVTTKRMLIGYSMDGSAKFWNLSSPAVFQSSVKFFVVTECAKKKNPTHSVGPEPPQVGS